MKLSPGRLAGASARHPWRTIGLWVVLVVTITLLSGVAGGNTNDQSFGFTNHPEAQVADELIKQHLGNDTRAKETIAIHSESLTVEDPAFKDVVVQTLSNLEPWKPDIATMTNYYDVAASGAPEAAQIVSKDHHSLLIPIVFNQESIKYESRGETYVKDAQAAANDQVKVYTVGDLSGSATYGKIAQEDTSKDITIGLPVAGVVLIVVFGALIAAFLPLLLGIIAIGATMGAVGLLSNLFVMQSQTMILATMIGLAVGIDYALFFMERFREERRHGALKVDAIERAGGTAGKALLFSGMTVVLALLGLMLLPITVFQGMAIASIATVLFAVSAALTLLPALLRLIGDWINFPRIDTMRKLKRQDRTRESAFEERQGSGFWGHVANGVMRRPGLSILLASGVLLLAALPVFTMRVGQQSDSSLPDTDYKSGYTILARDFYAGMQSPIDFVISGDANSQVTKDQVTKLTQVLKADSRLGDPTVQISDDGQLTLVQAVTTIDPSSKDAEDLVKELRDTAIPAAFGNQANSVHIGGNSAFIYDFDEALTSRLPLVFAFVLGLSFLLLLVAFRSILVPVMSIVLNLLSVGAAYGLMVAVFQHGWGASLFGFTQVESITNYLPVFIFCILFGLSMDYHVFLLSRIREHWDHTHNNTESVAFGVQSTGRIITGAALIMVAVFSSFAMGRLVEIQQLGFGLGVAVLLDATLIRTILVPATMKILGRANWWFPRFLHWIPDPKIEGDLEPVALRPRTERNSTPPITHGWEPVAGE
ncbi:MAG: MMPL family transporter [Thermomicrobiales bacterium]